jgi:hypothetical protein
VLPLQAILVPVTASRTSNLLRTIATLFAVEIAQARCYTFMASVKLPWEAFWETLWRAIPCPFDQADELMRRIEALEGKAP